MAIIVGKDEKGNYIFGSSKGPGTSEVERNKAIELNDLVRRSMIELAGRIRKLGIASGKNKRSKVEAYWEFGAVIRRIFFESRLVDGAEKKLFWRNIEMNASEELLARNRGPNRIHVEYCFRLAGYPKELALDREWSEWVFLFDSPGVNSEERFDKWDESKLRANSSYGSRENTRSFIQCLNAILKNVQTEDLNNQELTRCYEGSMRLSRALVGASSATNSLSIVAKSEIHDHRNHVSELMDGKIGPDDFATKILGSTKTKPSV
jgi:hypothetical protein